MKRLFVLVAVASFLLGACSPEIKPLADPGMGELSLTSIVYAADGTIIAEWHETEDRVLVDFADLPVHLMNAIVAIEDQRFWGHQGVDLRAIARALVADANAGAIVQGGSTITQQYIKNVVLTPEVTIDRKVEEATLALRLEETLTKEQILERYVNTVYFGSGYYGVGSASEGYFGKPVNDLTLGEAALLAGFIQSPSSTDPRLHPEAALDRRSVVLNKLIELNWITAEEGDAARAEPLKLATKRVADQSDYPYFVEEVKRQLLDDSALGLTATDRYNALFRGGLRIYTTLDPTMQATAESTMAEILADKGPSGALVSIEPSTGYVRAIVGGADFYDAQDPVAQFNLATQGRRQAGSSFKPFVLAAALEQGMTLSTEFAGGNSITIQTPSGPWLVENYAGSNWPDLTLLEATVFSVNVIYAQLVNAVGPEAVADMAENAGITSKLEPFHSIALGAQEVSVFDMASGYGTFAAGGIHVEPTLVTHIETHKGVNLYQPVPVITEAMSNNTASQVTAALSEVVKRGTGQRAQIGPPIAGKTGTSQAHRDAWFVGYTPDLVTAVWVGYPEGQVAMEPPTTPITVVGGSYPAEIWSAYSSQVLTGVGVTGLASPDALGLQRVTIDTSTGFLAGPFCPREFIQTISVPGGEAPTTVCPIHNPEGIVEVGATDVPSVIGMDLGAATSALQAQGFFVTIEWDDGGGLPQGTVFGQSPSPGFPAQLNSVIELTLAGPAFDAALPSVLGFTIDEAHARMDPIGVGIKAIIEAEANPDDAQRRPGVIWKQDPAKGGAVEGTVTVWINP